MLIFSTPKPINNTWKEWKLSNNASRSHDKIRQSKTMGKVESDV